MVTLYLCIVKKKEFFENIGRVAELVYRAGLENR